MNACTVRCSSGAARRADGERVAALRVCCLQNEGLVPWGAQPDVLIDRYDVRSLLDMYVAPDPRCA